MDEFGIVHGVVKGIRIRPICGHSQVIVPFPHKHDFHQIAVFTKGGGWHEIDLCRYPIRQNFLYFTKRGQVHEWRLSPKTSGFVLDFTSSAVSRDWGPSSDSWSPEIIQTQFDLSKVAAATRTHIMSLITMMVDEYESQAPEFELSLRYCLMPLLIELRRLSKDGVSKKCEQDPIIEHFLEIVEEHFRTHHGVTFYAKKLGMTPRALTMRVSRTLGKAARTVIHNHCVLEAKRLLVYSAMTLSETAYEIGFSDVGHFARFFRKNVGVSPGKFRSEFTSKLGEPIPSLLSTDISRTDKMTSPARETLHRLKPLAQIR